MLCCLVAAVANGGAMPLASTDKIETREFAPVLRFTFPV